MIYSCVGDETVSLVQRTQKKQAIIVYVWYGAVDIPLHLFKNIPTIQNNKYSG